MRVSHHFSRRSGRPLGAVAIAVLNALASKPMTAREISDALQLSVPAAKLTCHRLQRRLYIEIESRVEVDGARRPVARYQLVWPGGQGCRAGRVFELPPAFFGR